MTSATQTYAYRGHSMLDPDAGRLALATSGGLTPRGLIAHPQFFQGLLTRAAPTAAALLAVADVARARYHDARRQVWSRDPVVTCDGERLRFESFSACCGVYARLDVSQQALDGDVLDVGTTNVDVNEPLRRCLARVGGGDPLHLAVGPEEVVATTCDGAVVEKKVPLPSRWLRGFAEVQVLSSACDLRAELRPGEATRFLRGLPRDGGLWAVPAGRGLRLSARPAAGAVRLAAAARLSTMLPLLRFGGVLRAYGPVVSAQSRPVTSVWELALPGIRYTLALSPVAYRGFSGEGAVLADLATAEAEADAEVVGDVLAFQPRLDADLLAGQTGLSRPRVRAALTRLGTAGRVGYDVADAAHFHRELPYRTELGIAANPRLKAAHALVADDRVRLTDTGTASVGRRRIRYGGAEVSCDCQWWLKYRGSRGPCKHVLAVQLVTVGTEAAP